MLLHNISSPMYTVLLYYCRYAPLQFTKNPEKYLKYDPEHLENCLRSFFDGGAT